MKNIQAQYMDLLEGRMSKANFMRNLRMTYPQFVTPTLSFDDSIRVLKGKRMLSEAPEGVYGHNPNAEAQKERGYDHVNYNQLMKGMKFELAKMPEITDEALVKAKEKALENILKDSDHYRDLIVSNVKEVKKMDADLKMKEVKADNHVDKANGWKVVKKNEPASANVVKKDAKKKESVQQMTQTPKKVKGVAVMEVPGKEKVIALKESILNEYKGRPGFFKKIADSLKISEEDLMKSPEKYLKLVKQKYKDEPFVITTVQDLISLNKNKSKAGVKALKEHILDELTKPNETREHIGLNSRVKKKGDDSKVGHVEEFDGDTALVKWDDGSKEHIQMNVLTKKDLPKHPDAAAAFANLPNMGSVKGPDTGVDPKVSQMQEVAEEDVEDRGSKLKRIKEMVVKAVKETMLKKGKTFVTADNPSSISALRQQQFQEVPNTKDVKGL